MRFLYGFILGLLLTLIGSILYLALAGGEYLLALSPRYQEMRTKLEPCEKVAAQRDLLTDRLNDLEKRFAELSSRFTSLGDRAAGEAAGPEPAPGGEAAPSAPGAEAAPPPPGGGAPSAP
ncbi:MAG: hypothetical protein QOD06_98 [Candidatus Binatota bacterium]|nr:hypothetical protein [Candidatus Binatota bacterium]